MNTIQIDNILFGDKICGPIFNGTHAIDALPTFGYGCYVINLAPSSHPGTHWVAVFCDTVGRVEYFDSAGRGAPNSFIKWWGPHRDFITNPYTLQHSTSDVCGQYTIFYLIHRCRGTTMRTILYSFTSNKNRNDRMVYDFVRRKYGVHPSMTM